MRSHATSSVWLALAPTSSVSSGQWLCQAPRGGDVCLIDQMSLAWSCTGVVELRGGGGGCGPYTTIFAGGHHQGSR
jgi:hypothetical protein